MMIPDSQIRQYLEEKAGKHPRFFSSHLEKGDLVAKYPSFDSEFSLNDKENVFYLIDRVDFPLPEGETPFSYVNKKIREKSRMIKSIADFWLRVRHENIKDGNILIPLSKAVKMGMGSCVTKAILSQILLQEKEDIFYVTGRFRYDGDRDGDGTGHTFNILFRSGEPHISDYSAVIPLSAIIPLKKRMIFPFDAIIKGIDDTSYPHEIIDDSLLFRRGKYYIY